MKAQSIALYLVAVAAAVANAKVYLDEKFTEDSFKDWQTSEWKGAENMGKWEITSGEWYGDAELARGMQVTEDARFYAIGKKLDESFSNEGKTTVVQYAVKNEKKGSSFCGGGYIKLLPGSTDLSTFGGDSPYHIMFGPDLCGYDVSRCHLIFSKDGENMLKKDDIKLDFNIKNEFTHVYTLIIKEDNTYKVLIDNAEAASGSLGDGQWSKFALKEIDDPTDTKPADWVDEAKIADPEAKKPEDWDEDEPKMIPDPEATKPSDWDDEEDGEWVPPQIENEKYKGKWTAPLIDNPAYKGSFVPKKIANPEYDPKNYVYSDIGAVGFELWVVNSGTIFSNLLITDDEEVAKARAEEILAPELVEKEKAAKKKFDDAKKGADAVEEDDEDMGEDIDEEDDDDKEEL